jgi:uncharacterized membrane protein YqjE
LQPHGWVMDRDRTAHEKEGTWAEGGDPVELASTSDLVERATRLSMAIARKEIDLAREEVKIDLSREKRTVQSMGLGALSAFFALQLLLVAAVFAFYEGGVLAGWLAALLGAVLLLAVGGAAGLWGWSSRVRDPLEMTRNSLQRTARWAKNRAKHL